MSVRRIVIIGAGGFAREVRWLAQSIRDADGGPAFTFAGYVVTDSSKIGPFDSREDIVGDYDWLRRHRDRFDALTIAIGTPESRIRVADALEREFDAGWWPCLVHPSSQLDRESCQLGHGSQVCAGVVMTVNVVLEPHAVVNFGATVGHETRIGRGCVINPGANVSGGVTMGAGTLVGTGAQILQYLEIGSGAAIGAGAVVVRAVAAGQTVVGVPAVARGGAINR